METYKLTFEKITIETWTVKANSQEEAEALKGEIDKKGVLVWEELEEFDFIDCEPEGEGELYNFI